MIKPTEEAQAIDQANAQKQQAAEQVSLAGAGVEGAKTLSETEVGGGINALQLMLGGAQGP